MDFIAGTLLVIIAFLLGSYYQKNANEDDYNRPSFFNSKKRKYFLLCCIILFVVGGGVLLLLGKYFIWIVLLPIIIYISNYFVKEASFQNTTIIKTFKFYKIFSSPEISFSKDERLAAPIRFMLSYINAPKDFRNKADKYLKERIKEGKIKNARDLPQEAWTVLGCIYKGEITQNSGNLLPQKKIDYFYEEIIEGKEHKDFLKTLSGWLRDIEIQFERLFKNFAFISQSRPDFTNEEVALVSTREIGLKSRGKSSEMVAIFPEWNEYIAKKFGWVKDSAEYYLLASLEFSRRFPKHEFSKEIKKKYKYSNKKYLTTPGIGNRSRAKNKAKKN